MSLSRWRFERDPWMEAAARPRSVTADAVTVLKAWAALSRHRRYRILSAIEMAAYLDASLEADDADRTSGQDLGRLVVKFGLVRRPLDRTRGA